MRISLVVAVSLLTLGACTGARTDSSDTTPVDSARTPTASDTDLGHIDNPDAPADPERQRQVCEDAGRSVALCEIGYRDPATGRERSPAEVKRLSLARRAEVAKKCMARNMTRRQVEKLRQCLHPRKPVPGKPGWEYVPMCSRLVDCMGPEYKGDGDRMSAVAR